MPACSPSTLSCSCAAGRPRVERGHQHLALVALVEALRELRGGRRLAGALQADHHERDRRRRIQIDRLGLGAERAHQLVVDDLDDHLPRRDRAHHLLADGLLAHPVRERLHDLQRHVRLEQRAADLAHGLGDVAIGQRTAACELVENAGQAIGRDSNMAVPLVKLPRGRAAS